MYTLLNRMKFIHISCSQFCTIYNGEFTLRFFREFLTAPYIARGRKRAEKLAQSPPEWFLYLFDPDRSPIDTKRSSRTKPDIFPSWAIGAYWICIIFGNSSNLFLILHFFLFQIKTSSALTSKTSHIFVSLRFFSISFL